MSDKKQTERLTAKQQRFIQNYIANGNNATQAALDAGYSQKTAFVIGCQNLSKVKIQQAIEAYRKQLAEENRVTVESLAKDADKIFQICSNSYLDDMGNHRCVDAKSALSAMDMKAKLFGLYAPEKRQTEIKHLLEIKEDMPIQQAFQAYQQSITQAQDGQQKH